MSKQYLHDDLSVYDITRPADEEYSSGEYLFIDSIEADSIPRVGDTLVFQTGEDDWDEKYVVHSIEWIVSRGHDAYNRDRGAIHQAWARIIYVKPLVGAK